MTTTPRADAAGPDGTGAAGAAAGDGIAVRVRKERRRGVDHQLGLGGS